MCHNNNPNLATMEMIRMAGIKGIQVKYSFKFFFFQYYVRLKYYVLYFLCRVLLGKLFLTI